MTIHGYGVMQQGGPVVPFAYEPIAVGADHVEIAIDACGVCHSDLHQQQNDWSGANYPLVPGHEIIGRIVAVGANVEQSRLGQRVGVGPQVGACQSCRECDDARPQHCRLKIKSYNTLTGVDTQPYTFGGFATHIRCHAAWAFPIPGIPFYKLYRKRR